MVAVNHIRYIFFLSLSCFLIAMFNISNVACAESGNSVISGKSNGLYKATLQTRAGKINVVLPDDMSAGDTISGTVIAEPSGADSTELEINSDELNGYVVEIEIENKPVGKTEIQKGKLESVSIPEGFSSGAAKIKVSDPKGEELIVAELPVEDSPNPLQYTAPPSPGDFKLPYVGKAGEPIQVIGPFDGTFDTTTVKIGGNETQVLAESPRQAVVEIPDSIKDRTTIEVVERGVKSTGELRISDSSAPVSEESLNGLWITKSGKSTWRISQQGQNVGVDSIVVPEEDQIRGYKPQANIMRGSLNENLLVGKIQQFFLIPIEECMAMCPSECEQWNEIKLVVSQDGKTLEGQIQEKAINTETCTVIEFGWIPWAMTRKR